MLSARSSQTDAGDKRASLRNTSVYALSGSSLSFFGWIATTNAVIPAPTPPKMAIQLGFELSCASASDGAVIAATSKASIISLGFFMRFSPLIIMTIDHDIRKPILLHSYISHNDLNFQFALANSQMLQATATSRASRVATGKGDQA